MVAVGIHYCVTFAVIIILNRRLGATIGMTAGKQIGKGEGMGVEVATQILPHLHRYQYSYLAFHSVNVFTLTCVWYNLRPVTGDNDEPWQRKSSSFTHNASRV